MTETEWLACDDPAPMLEYLQGAGAGRKLQLFACACCRRVWHRLPDPRSRFAVEETEAFIDGEISSLQLALLCPLSDRLEPVPLQLLAVNPRHEVRHGATVPDPAGRTPPRRPRPARPPPLSLIHI